MASPASEVGKVTRNPTSAGGTPRFVVEHSTPVFESAYTEAVKRDVECLGMTVPTKKK
jgi:hypothetical protein